MSLLYEYSLPCKWDVGDGIPGEGEKLGHTEYYSKDGNLPLET